MRLQSLAIAGFRGFPTPVQLDLDADAIIVAGVNGSGKTSFFDAILWALCGSVDRLSAGSDVVVSEYSPSGEARVEVVLRADDRSTVTVVRRYDGVMHLTMQRDASTSVTGPAADALLIDLLWPDAKSAADQVVALTRSLTRATYLQQDAVRAFVDADSEQVRFQVVGELVGAGRIAELQRQLESSRNAWTRATTALTKDVQPLQAQRTAIVERLNRLQALSDIRDIEPEFHAWNDAVAATLGRASSVATGDRSTDVSADALDRSLADLLAREQAEARGVAGFERLVAHLATQPPAAVDLAPLDATAMAAESQRSAVSERLAAAQHHAAERRRLQVEVSERTASLRALAQLALRHLDETCPVCNQTYDHDATRSRLEGLLEGVPFAHQVDQESGDVTTVAHELEIVERKLATAQAAVRTAQVVSQRRGEWARTLEALTQQAALPPGGVSMETAKMLLSRAQALIARIRDLRTQGERLSLGLAQASELTQRVDLEQQLVSVNAALARQTDAIEMRKSTGELASRVIDALRAATSSVVTKQLERIEPLLQRIFATVDPHPTFRVVSFLTKMTGGHGQLWTTLDDVQGHKSIQDPSLVLSSSQLNVLAVAIFLSLNLVIPTLPLQVVALDDPLQSLDTVNLLGLADLLRRVKATRQVIVSTHDERLASLLVRKLRPVSPDQRTVRIDLRGWTPEGPVVERTEVQQDPSPLRLVASA